MAARKKSGRKAAKKAAKKTAKKAAKKGGRGAKKAARRPAKKAAKKAAKKTAKKAAKKAAPKKAAKKAAPKKAAKKTKRKPNPAFMKPMKPSADLGAVVGSNPLPRTEVTKKIWEYVKKNKLQEGRTIHADDKLRKVFGGRSSVTMFEMTKLVNRHLS
jgi:chromatin remodeling complex protein RSC6